MIAAVSLRLLYLIFSRLLRVSERGVATRPRIDDCAALEGILLVLDTGCRWRDAPRGAGLRIRAHRVATAARVAGRRRLGPAAQLVLDELSDARLLEWSRACIDGVSMRSKRGAS
jgi:transposase